MRRLVGAPDSVEAEASDQGFAGGGSEWGVRELVGLLVVAVRISVVTHSCLLIKRAKLIIKMVKEIEVAQIKRQLLQAKDTIADLAKENQELTYKVTVLKAVGSRLPLESG